MSKRHVINYGGGPGVRLRGGPWQAVIIVISYSGCVTQCRRRTNGALVARTPGRVVDLNHSGVVTQLSYGGLVARAPGSVVELNYSGAIT